MGSCDLCPNESGFPTVPVCSREDCAEVKHVCLRCLEEAFCKYAALAGAQPIGEGLTVLEKAPV